VYITSRISQKPKVKDTQHEKPTQSIFKKIVFRLALSNFKYTYWPFNFKCWWYPDFREKSMGSIKSHNAITNAIMGNSNYFGSSHIGTYSSKKENFHCIIKDRS